MIVKYTTESGSVYEVRTSGIEENRETHVRRVLKSEVSGGERVGPDWRQCAKVSVLDECLVMVWGMGRDEHSPVADFDGPRVRTTVSTRIVSAEALPE